MSEFDNYYIYINFVFICLQWTFDWEWFKKEMDSIPAEFLPEYTCRLSMALN